jgi:hypothetical protein
MTCLINGCSFSLQWKPSTEFLSKLNQKNFVNISKVATSFRRTVRSTVEWISQNDKPDLVIIPITYAHRFEMAISKEEEDIDGTWLPIQRSELLDPNKVSDSVDIDKLSSMIDNYYGCVPDVRQYWDSLFTDLIMFTGWLSSNNVDYIAFDMCNNFEKIHINNLKAMEKIKLIEKDKKIIDLFSFSGNKIMHDSMKETIKNKIDPYGHHHSQKEFLVLEKEILKHRSLVV